VKPVATLVAITLLLLAGPLTGAALAAPGPAAPAQEIVPDVVAGPLRLELTQVTPRVVTAGGPRILSVTGTLTNTGDRAVDELEIRVQRGDPLGSEGALRDALDGAAGTDAVTPRFVPLPGELPPGAQLPVRLTMPLRGAGQDGLALAATGVHELLVNVNGVPRDGARARLAAVRMLLPVLSLPPDPAAPDPLHGATTGGATTGGAMPFALLYPITDAPRRVSTVPGEPTLLTDDDLAASFAPQGRLGGLVAALAEAAPVGSRTREATCLAVDPDLVETASRMREGYQFRGPDGVPVPGAGADVAGRWLDDLVAVARDSCVIALPRADADLVALTRGGLGELARSAITDGRTVLADLLRTPIVPDVTWPADGVVDGSTLDQIAQADGRSLLLSADAVKQDRVQRSVGVQPIAGGRTPQFAVLTDPLLFQSAAGPDAAAGDEDSGRGIGSGTGRGGPVAADTPAGTVAPLSTQDAIGALAFRTQDGAAAADRGAGPLVLAPPHQWAAEGVGARALLTAVDQLIAAGRLVPSALDGVLASGPTARARAQSVTYPPDAGAREISGAVVATVRDTSTSIDDLRSAAVEGSGVGVSPDEAFTPLSRGLVRPASAAWRGRPGAADSAAAAGASRVAELRASVRVLEPPSPYSLGTSNAPILITIANGLPVTVEVRVEILPSSGLRVAPIEPQRIPPLGRRQVRVSAEVTRSGQFTVQAAARTPDGELLGPPSRLRMRSTAYGTITLWLTGSAGVLLVVLAVRRVLRRVRGEPGRHTLPGHPEPGPGSRPPDRARRDTPYPESPRPDPHSRTPLDRASPAPPRAPWNGDPFPGPLGATEPLPAARRRPDAPPRRPPGPPRVPSP
jgi:hypothetical protein